MASESSSLSQSTKDEFEGLEVIEFDANALWELLYDEPGEEEQEGKSAGGDPMQAMEVVGPKPDFMAESYYSYIDDVINGIEDFNWLSVIEETSRCNDIGGWSEGACMNEIFEVGDYTVPNSAVLCDEIGYIGLWQDN